MRKATEFFLEYVKIDTQSKEASTCTPSTSGQRVLANLLARQLKQMGAAEVLCDETYGYVYATIPASPGCEDWPVLGFIAHMDTSPAVSGAGVKPRLVENYDGGDILLNQERQIVLKTAEFPELAALKGQDLIVTDGTTLLGADDKAGIAEIMAAASFFLSERPKARHGKLRLGFTPDEEIGKGADHFDVSLFGADFAYTVDGGAFGELEDETFHAAAARLTVQGVSVHPGSAKGKMKNAILIAQEFQSLLPVFDNPMYTQGREGFYHLDAIRGDVERTEAEYIIRDHDRNRFEKKKAFFGRCADFLNEKYGAGTASVQIQDSYRNMKEALDLYPQLTEAAGRILRELGAEPKRIPIRGGTDGARLSFMGLPCPNLCTGGGNFHSRFEYVCVQSMEKVTELLIRLAQVNFGESGEA